MIYNFLPAETDKNDNLKPINASAFNPLERNPCGLLQIKLTPCPTCEIIFYVYIRYILLGSSLIRGWRKEEIS
jgi:hypothetical protein